MKELLITSSVVIGVVIFVLIIMTFLIAPLDKWACQEKTQGMHGHSWGIVQGCLVHLKDGRKIPLENYRFDEGANQ